MVDGKKRLKKNFWFWGRIGELIQYGIPIAYIILEYDVFVFKEKKSFSGWVFLIVFILYFFFKNKVKMIIKDYNNNLGDVAQKAKWGILFFTLSVFLILAELWIRGTFFFLLTLGISNVLSLPFYTVYYTRKNNYEMIKSKIKEMQIEQKIKDYQ